MMAMELDSSHHHPFHPPFSCLFSCNNYVVMVIFVHNDKDQDYAKDQDNEEDDFPTIIEPLMKVLKEVMVPPLPPLLFVAITFVVIVAQTRRRTTILSQPHFGQSVRMRLTLPKVGTWSPSGLLQF